jgi:hypothetical protein
MGGLRRTGRASADNAAGCGVLLACQLTGDKTYKLPPVHPT